jgi:hypothetical protein
MNQVGSVTENRVAVPLTWRTGAYVSGYPFAL